MKTMKFNAITVTLAFPRATVVMDLEIVQRTLMNQNSFALRIGINPKVHINFTLWLKILVQTFEVIEIICFVRVLSYLLSCFSCTHIYILTRYSVVKLLSALIANGIKILLTASTKTDLVWTFFVFSHGYEMS